MNSANVHQFNTLMQDRQEGRLTMNGFALQKLTHNLIREYGSYKDGSYVVKLSDLSLSDKKLLLSHIIESDEYEEICVNPYLAEMLFQEKEDYLWKLIDRECDEVYHEDMEERRQYA
jgi:hypothetical protein